MFNKDLKKIILENTKAEDWNNGLLAINWGDSIKFLNREYKMFNCDHKLIKENKGCWTVEAKKGLNCLLISFNNDPFNLGTILYPENCLDVIERVYENPLEIKNIELKDLKKYFNNNLRLPYMLMADLIKLGSNALDDRIYGLKETFAKITSQNCSEEMKLIQFAKLVPEITKINTAKNEYNSIAHKKIDSLSPDIEEDFGSEEDVDVFNSEQNYKA